MNPIDMLSNSALKTLDNFLGHQHNAVIFQSAHYIRGLLFAVCTSPDIPMPEQWFPWVVKQGGQIQSQQVDKVASILMQLLKEQLQAMRDEKVQLPADCHFGEQDEHLAQWMTGLTSGHKLLEPIWQEAWQVMLDKHPSLSETFAKDLSRCLRMFSTFADLPLATQQAKARGVDNFSQQLPVLAKSLSNSLRDYVRLSGELVSFLPNQFDTFQQNMPGQ